MFHHITVAEGEDKPSFGTIKNIRFSEKDSKFHIFVETLDGEMRPQIQRRKDFEQS